MKLRKHLCSNGFKEHLCVYLLICLVLSSYSWTCFIFQTAPEIVPIRFNIVNSTFIMFMWQSANGTQRELIKGYRLSITAVKSERRVDFLLLDASLEGYNKTNAAGKSTVLTVLASTTLIWKAWS